MSRAVILALAMLPAAFPATAQEQVTPVQWERPPIPAYPTSAAQRGLEGICQVSFSVRETGEPYNINATCTDSVFTSAATRAVERARVAPKLAYRSAIGQSQLMYSVQFRLG